MDSLQPRAKIQKTQESSHLKTERLLPEKALDGLTAKIIEINRSCLDSRDLALKKDTIHSVVEWARSNKGYLELSLEGQTKRFIVSYPPTSGPKIFHLTDRIGRGASAQVYRAVNMTAGTFGAIKLAENTNLINPGFESRTVLNEVEILNAVYVHNKLDRIPGLCPNPELLMEEGTGKLGAAIWMPLYDCNVQDRHDMTAYGQIIRDLFTGISAVHKAGYAHNDISNGNVMMKLEPLDLALIDFGLASSRVLKPKKEMPWENGADFYLKTDNKLRDAFIEEQNAASYKELLEKRDIFRMGLVITDLFTDKAWHWNQVETPDAEFDEKSILERRSIEDLEEIGVPMVPIRILEDCLSVDFKERPTAESILHRIHDMV